MKVTNFKGYDKKDKKWHFANCENFVFRDRYFCKLIVSFEYEYEIRILPSYEQQKF